MYKRQLWNGNRGGGACPARRIAADLYLSLIHIFLVCLGLVLAAGTAGWVVSAGHGADDPEAQWVVVLGAGVNGTVPSQALRERLEAARDYLARYPEAVAVLSGAQGDGESITEARCMYDLSLIHI